MPGPTPAAGVDELPLTAIPIERSARDLDQQPISAGFGWSSRPSYQMAETASTEIRGAATMVRPTGITFAFLTTQGETPRNKQKRRFNHGQQRRMGTLSGLQVVAARAVGSRSRT